MNTLRTLAAAAAFACLPAANTSAHCVQKYAWMISQTTCPYCDQARAFFRRNNVPFQEYFVEDRRIWKWNIGNVPQGTVRAFAQNRYGWITTPIIEIDGVTIRGLLIKALEKETCTTY